MEELSAGLILAGILIISWGASLMLWKLRFSRLEKKLERLNYSIYEHSFLSFEERRKLLIIEAQAFISEVLICQHRYMTSYLPKPSLIDSLNGRDDFYALILEAKSLKEESENSLNHIHMFEKKASG